MRLRYDDSEWRVCKTFGDIYSLHRSLLAARAKARVKKLVHIHGGAEKFPPLPNAAKLGYNEDTREQADFGQVNIYSISSSSLLFFLR